MLLRKKKKTARGVSGLLKRLFRADVPERELEELEELLLRSDVGAQTVGELISILEERIRQSSDASELAAVAADVLSEHLLDGGPQLDSNSLHIFIVLGVNGVGKTTTIAKLAHWYRQQENIQNICLAAGDTFRAAAVQQLKLHGERLKLRVIAQSDGADSAAVVYDALDSAAARGDRLLIVDTAGRMHNKKHLVEELAKINRIIERKKPDAVVHRILVIDSTTGQNALRQAETFQDAVGVDYAVITKYDSTARAGIAIPVCRNLGIPVAFLGTGETYDDLKPFNIREYVGEILA